MSPELAKEKGYTFTTDIWSAGCVLYELLTLKRAFKGYTQLQVIELHKNVEDIVENVSVHFYFKSLLKKYFNICIE
jgi:serine/threonine protein kinase